MPLSRAVLLVFLVFTAPLQAADEPAKQSGNLDFSINGLLVLAEIVRE